MGSSQQLYRHPEVAAQRPSKDTAAAPIEIGFADFEDV
jgi:hypothetical protein